MRNPNAKHIDFKDLMGIPHMGRILPANIDMVMERNGYFLIGEWKRENERPMSKGQELLLIQMARMPNFTVLIIQGNTDDGSMVVDEFWQMDDRGFLDSRGKGIEKFKKLLVFWKTQVEKRKYGIQLFGSQRI